MKDISYTVISHPVCIYCGEPSTEEDHYPPLSRKDDYRDEGGDVFVIVPSCRECNITLFNSLTLTFPERKIVLNSRIRDKYSKTLTNSKWTTEELEDMDYSLRDYVLKGNAALINLINRLKYTKGLEAFYKTNSSEKDVFSLIEKLL